MHVAAELFGRHHFTVAATSGGPARKIVPCSRTMMVTSDMAGTQAHPPCTSP